MKRVLVLSQELVICFTAKPKVGGPYSCSAPIPQFATATCRPTLSAWIYSQPSLHKEPFQRDEWPTVPASPEQPPALSSLQGQRSMQASTWVPGKPVTGRFRRRLQALSFETGSHVAQADLDYATHPRITMYSGPSASISQALGLQVCGITLGLH